MPGCSVRTLPFSTSRDAMLTMLVCATHWLSIHLYMLAHMSIHGTCLPVCRPCFNTMKLLTFDPNLHLSLVDTTFCFLSCLFTFSLVFLLSFFFAWMSIMLICFMSLSYALCIFSFHCLSASFLSLPLHVHTQSKDTQSQGTVSLAQAKRARMQACGYKPSGYVQQIQGSSLPYLVMYSFKPISFLPHFSLRWVVLGISCHVPFVLIPRV